MLIGLSKEEKELSSLYETYVKLLKINDTLDKIHEEFVLFRRLSNGQFAFFQNVYVTYITNIEDNHLWSMNTLRMIDYLQLNFQEIKALSVKKIYHSCKNDALDSILKRNTFTSFDHYEPDLADNKKIFSQNIKIVRDRLLSLYQVSHKKDET
jgi:hypothetical protein